MTRKFLQELDLSGETIDKIMSAHGEGIERQKALYKELQKELESVKEAAVTDEWKQKYEQEQLAHTATKEAHTAEKEAEIVDGLVLKALKAAGMNEAVISKAIKHYDRAVAELNDGQLSNEPAIIDYFRAEWGDFFGKVKEIGADVGTANSPHMQKNPWSKAHRNLSQQTKIYRENPAMAMQMAKAAGVRLD